MSTGVRRCDVAIVGGGMVGASLALALQETSLTVALIEAVPPDSGAQPSFDERTTALGNGARRILGTLGVWPQLAARAAAIRSIHVSDAGRFGFARLEAAEHGLAAFGYTVSNRHIGATLWQGLEARGRIALLCPARTLEVRLGDEAVHLRVATASGGTCELQAALVVAADGAHSLVKQAAGIASNEEQYGRVALVANIRTDRPARGIAYERFAGAAAMALLPLASGSYTAVWTLEPSQADAMRACEPGRFCEALQGAFGWRVGRICEVGTRAAYPLALVRALEHTGRRAVLIGNAAQALHPIAAQGFNLGLRDAAVLAELLVSAPDPGAPSLLSQFAARRAADRRAMIAFTDGLVKLFGDARPAAIAARNLGLLLFDLSPPAKRALSRLSVGFGGQLPRLSRGLRLVPGEDP